MPSINVKLTEEEFKTLSDCKPKGETWKRYLLSSTWIKGRLCAEPKMEWGKAWKPADPTGKITKPCHDCGFCPYGQVVEMFPFQTPRDDYSCRTFGHNCPVFYLAEPIAE